MTIHCIHCKELILTAEGTNDDILLGIVLHSQHLQRHHAQRVREISKGKLAQLGSEILKCVAAICATRDITTSDDAKLEAFIDTLLIQAVDLIALIAQRRVKLALTTLDDGEGESNGEAGGNSQTGA